MFLSRAHPYLGWEPLRQQLSAARTTEAFGDVPLLAALLAELDSIERLFEQSGRLPFDDDAHRTFRSIVSDLEGALGQLGPQLARLAGPAVGEVIGAASSTPRQGGPPWERLLADTAELRAGLRHGSAVSAGFGDAIAAAEKTGENGGYGRLGRRLDDLRAVAELQGRDWKAVCDVAARHLSMPPDARAAGSGEFARGTAGSEILDSLRTRIADPPAEQEWIVWVGTLAGPGGARDRFDSLVSGPVAVCGLPCREDVDEWLEDVRMDLTMAFREAGQDPPADVRALGTAAELGFGPWSATGLWESLAKPSSFVARVAVLARSTEQATDRAKALLRALYGMEDPRVARDLRSRTRVWMPQGGWSSGRIDARDHAEGELYATQAGLKAAALWARDLASPLADSDLERLAARSLVRDPDASLDVRLARAFSALEGMRSPALKLEQFPYRLWYHDAWDRAHRLVDNAVAAVSGILLEPAITGEDARQALRALQRELDGSRRSPRERIALARRAAATLRSNDIHRRFVEDSATALDDRATFSRERAAHTAAFARARRHRNLVVHGHRLSETALAPSVAFLTRCLEVAVAAEAARARELPTACLGSLKDEPAIKRPGPQSFGALFDLVRERPDRTPPGTAPQPET